MNKRARFNRGAERQEAARQLAAGQERIQAARVFAGLDGFVDEIVHIVDKRDTADHFARLRTMEEFAARVQAAAGMSTNIEMVNQQVKLGGNGPIFANALAALGCRVTYVGSLGYPTIHHVFDAFSKRAKVFSIAEHGHTQALEFEDGKLMLVKSAPLADLTWSNIDSRFGREPFAKLMAESDLIGFVNWTMIPQMSSLWEKCLGEFCAPSLERRLMFFDLADPEKRPVEDLVRALELVAQFEKYFIVTLGLNHKEAMQVARALGISAEGESQAELICLAEQLYAKLGVTYLVIHPVPYALVAHQGGVNVAYGPHITEALITTGAGDHFNAGFCMGALLKLPPGLCVTLGVATSGFYVKNGATPALIDLISFLEKYPVQKEEEAQSHGA